MPFRKNVKAHKMFDSRSQRELGQALGLWTEIKGLALVTGPTGVGKSITLRRFVLGLDESRFKVWRFHQVPTTPNGFLRSLSRLLGLPMRRHLADLFDQARDHLSAYAENHGPHPVLLLDDAEGMRPEALDLMRRLTAGDLDAEDAFSVLMVGTEDLLRVLQHPVLASLRSRFGYAQQLRPFNLEDTLNYIRFHLEGAGADPSVFTDEAARELFQASQGTPRAINQLALQGLIQAVVEGRDELDGRFVHGLIASHPLYRGADR